MADDVCTVSCQEDGPLLVEGELEVRGPGAGEARSASRVWLCRCGDSANKPYCDGSHRESGFRASGPIDTSRAVSSSDGGGGGGGVIVTPHANGPVHLDGVVEVSGAGHEGSARFAKPWLCRCGASANKPFCDGAHKQTGFEAEGL